MLFVTLGSQKFQFNRLLKAIDDLVDSGEIKEEIFAQKGYSDYTPNNYSCKNFLDRNEYLKFISRADIVITHGGSGAIMGAVKKGKKVIAVPRLAKYGEHVDDHQLQIIKQFTRSNLIADCNNLDDLGKLIKSVQTQEFDKYISCTQRYIDELDHFISSCV